MVTEEVPVEIEDDNLEDGVVVVVNENVVVGEDEDKVGTDRRIQEDRLQKYVVEVDNTLNPYHAGLDEEVVKNEEVMVVKKVK